MEILGEFYEKDINGNESSGEVLYKVRKGARAVLLNSSGEVAMMFATEKLYHKLPGGGVEKGENLRTALEREIREETGFGISIWPEEVGAIIEYRDTDKLLQISYCFLADAAGEPEEPALTEEEKSQGFQLEWMKPEVAIETLEDESPSEYFVQFIRQRDLLFLRSAKDIIEKKKR